MRADRGPLRSLGALALVAVLVPVGTARGAQAPEAAAHTAYTASPAAGPGAADEVHDERTVIDKGHVDAIAPRLVDGVFRTLLKDSRTAAAVWREPGSVVLHLTEAGRKTVPDPAGGLSFLGEPGDTYYSVPQTQDPEVLWAGWNTEEFGAADVRDGLRLSLDAVDGPGSLLVFGWSPFGEPLMRFDTRDGLPDTYAVPAGTHEHANWVFTEPGVYRMTFTFDTTLASGDEVSDSQVFTMAVGDVDPGDVSLPGDPGDGDFGGQTGGDTGGDTAGGSDGGGASEGDGAGGADNGGGSGSGSAGGAATGGNSSGGGGSSAGDSAVGDESTQGGATASGGGTAGSGAGGTTSGSAASGAVGDGTSAQGGTLAATGTGSAVPLGAGAAVLVAAGAGVVVTTRRRSRRIEETGAS
ncbi:choice-of-anchor M domain-containing protein [Streptomyces sp. NPDC050560]|uniref:choice-of-anchor M domain-containing protein n=1 Tax=Streptomyces sp. NPDC050560 TaxID=3365630 RepID=UPI0037A7ED3B